MQIILFNNKSQVSTFSSAQILIILYVIYIIISIRSNCKIQILNSSLNHREYILISAYTHTLDEFLSCSFLQTAGRDLALATAQACKCHRLPHYFLPLLCIGFSFALCRSLLSLSFKQESLQSRCILCLWTISWLAFLPRFHIFIES